MSDRFFRNSLILIGIVIILLSGSIQIVNANDKQSYVNKYGSLIVYPKISENIIRQKQYWNLTSKITNTIDVVFRFNFSLSYGGLYFFNGNKYIKLNVQHIENNGYHYYVYQNFNVVNGTSYNGYWTYDTPIFSNGKWDLFVKLSTDPIGTWRIHLDPWWDGDWDYYKTIYVSPKIEGYQTEFNVSKTSGGDVDCEGHCKNDFSDLRFVYNNVTELPYWIQNYTSGDQCTVFVNNTGNYSSFEMYYGNSGASTTSDGYNTFYFFDDGGRYTDIAENWEIVDGGANIYQYSATQNWDYNTTKSIMLTHSGGYVYLYNQTWQLDNARIIWEFYPVGNYGSQQYFYSESGGDIVLTLRVDLDRSIKYYQSGSYQDTGEDVAINDWSELEAWCYYGSDTVVLKLNNAIIESDAHRETFDHVGRFNIGTTITSTGTNYWDAIRVCKLAVNQPVYTFSAEQHGYFPPTLEISNIFPSNNSYYCNDLTNLTHIGVHVECPYGDNFNLDFKFLGKTYSFTNVGNGTYNVSLSYFDFPELKTNYTWVLNATSTVCHEEGGYCQVNASYNFDICCCGLNLWYINDLSGDIDEINISGNNSFLSDLSFSNATIGVFLVLFLLFLAEWKDDPFYFMLVSVLTLPLGVYLVIYQTEMFDVFLGISCIGVSAYTIYLCLHYVWAFYHKR